MRFDCSAQPIRLEGAISDDQCPFEDDLNQRLAAAEVGCVATEEVERDRLAALVGRRMDLRAPSTT